MVGHTQAASEIGYLPTPEPSTDGHMQSITELQRHICNGDARSEISIPRSLPYSSSNETFHLCLRLFVVAGCHIKTVCNRIPAACEKT